jgi:hypothetical protein
MASIQETAMRLAQTSSARLQRIREEQKELIEKAAGAAGSAGSAYFLGLHEGRRPNATKILGVDVELAVGASALIASLIPQVERSIGRTFTSALEGVGNGGLAVYTFKRGLEMGKK